MFGLDPFHFWTAIAVTVAAGFVKGAIGFAMPIIMVSVLGSFLTAQQALAAVILPVLITNIHQALRRGWRPAWQAVLDYRWHIGALLVVIPLSAGLATVVPQWLMYGLLGLPITAYALWQLAGRSMVIPVRHRRGVEIGSGIIGGLYGGIAGIWGPPLIVLLLSINAPKEEQMRVQGVVFFLGAAILTVAHLQTGVLNADSLPFSAILVIPAVIGMALGYLAHDRLDIVQFRRWTLILLTLTGLNLIRRALELGGLPV
ncbi:sulfite exporter TauE/SafE family protein [Paracoccus shanxieyensis]|uniref:Probable membrane transporter protein n=1 Tax=Paracoccus shanxieyensis TaxID=2675752 RepID=A0A6L6IYW0_9RHOB|nr:sulfite exporter TauE/SafE family protein [Paracoccus shanxieyensis]MTH65705.1 TSUP family transporter [Paracoccus shanxieyensis]MTH88920.1 TSUP family transporter [Paracoccus shanxieyensis]